MTSDAEYHNSAQFQKHMADGGQAFPSQRIAHYEYFGGPTGPAGQHIQQHSMAFGNPVYQSVPGMSLRDWFAGQALAAMSADLLRNQEYGATMRELVKKAYFIADCMIEARNK